jgi:hypothetical protein
MNLSRLYSLIIPEKPEPTPALHLPFVLFTVALSVVWTTAMASWEKSNGQTAALLSIVQLCLYVGYWWKTRDKRLGGLLLFGAVFGVVELIADALCVYSTGTLDYSIAGSPMLWLSPWWMPIAWMIVAVQIGYLGFWIIGRLGVWRGALLTAILGAVNIPYYEEMAYHANWWQYRDCQMVGHTPLYIVVAEFCIGLVLGPIAAAVYRTDDLRTVLLLGILGGGATIIGGLVGYGVVEFIPPLLLGEPIPFVERFWG